MAKNNRPQAANPLAGLNLEEIARNITSAETAYTSQEEIMEEEIGDADEEAIEDGQTQSKQIRRGNMKLFEKNLAAYKGLNEQGFAIWLPRDVKKKLELIRLNASRTIPLRALASAIIMTYIQENEEKLNNL